MDMAALAALPPAYHEEYNGGPMLVAAWVTLGVIVVITGLRVYGRCFLMEMGTRGMKWDDTLMVMGTVFGVMYCIAMILTYTYGGGYHMATIILKIKPNLDMTKYMLCVFIAGPPFMIAMGFIKCSMLALYWRLSRPGSFFRHVTIFMLVFVVLMTIGLCLGIMLPCRPVDKFWNIMKPGSCVSLGPYYFAQSALLIATDFIVCLLPLRMIWRVQLPLRQKITLCVLFGCGSTACIAGVVKLSYMPILLKSKDTPYIGTIPLVWTFIELSIGTIAACGPSLKIVVKRIAPRLLGSSNISTDPYPSRGGEGRESTGGAKSLTEHYNSIHMKSLKSQNQKSKKHLSVTETEVGSESTERIIPVTNIMRTTVVRQNIEVEN